ncbi:receptor-like serine/threonine-protein kinase ALE2 [Impatiens glandulifera]|uniref:receptor-like serine/threonine-protein kinase ALE2 n=1 Tax=Impatiens glandulifera TaxID=253017 RepID=UPI001FB18ADE|nr:receptor-like serine/threonine-protein kinase ALE2 [Impatiens glandulifera]
MARHSKSATNPKSSPEIGYHSPASSPNISSLSPRYVRRNKTSQAPSPSTLPSSHKRAPLYPPKPHQGSAEGIHAPSQDSADSSISPSFSSRPSSSAHISRTQAPTIPSGKETMLHHSPKFSPSWSSPSPKIPLTYHGLPPPPPNEECSSISCTDPLTYPVHGSPCVCVVPMQVGLRITVSLYTFFPSVAELSDEIASGIFMRQSQVRIMGANADSQDEEKTVVLIDLVPLEEKFDNTTAFLTYLRFWNKQIVLKSSLFGDYEVLYVHYPGLPVSPPPSSTGIINGVPNHGNNGRTKPLGVDVSGQQHHKQGLSSSIVAIIVLSAFLCLVLCSLFAWILLFKDRENREKLTPIASLLSASKPSGIGASLLGSMRSSASMSFGSSLVVYTGSAKGFSLIDIERATDNFNSSRVLGEGGFGKVYSGVLEDGSKVAVKVLKRDDLQGGREFLAEVEMLSRLHHRNLVKLIGICTEENARCLVYELVPNGSVESHLHGVDKEAAPLDWGARMKIALGAARGLAYLHEDSSPRVIHRDFKSSNILLEHDFMPKVSDFGLARSAMDEQDTHISTRVMGTFGYVAPEYAMTGHLLVKSDVYSYGVVLLELLTGRKPVDMSQPPGQENLVAWARPMLSTIEGFESIIDPSLGPDFPFDSIAKVVAIASMCVQPEVSHRPFMGEVVQALKLMCNDCEDDAVSVEMDAARSSSNSDMLFNHLQYCHSPVSNYCSGLDAERGFTVSDIFDNSVRLGRQNTGVFRVFSSSGPLRLGGRTREGLWKKLKKLSGGTMSEHGTESSI